MVIPAFITNLAELLASVATVLGIPWALLLYRKEKRRERLEREYGTYDSLDEKYLEYLRICLDHPDLDLYWLPAGAVHEIAEEKKTQQYALFEMLVSLMERSYLLYNNPHSELSDEFRRNQWQGWDQYIRTWCDRGLFVQLWEDKKLGTQFDEEFTQYVADILGKKAAARHSSASIEIP